MSHQLEKKTLLSLYHKQTLHPLYLKDLDGSGFNSGGFCFIHPFSLPSSDKTRVTGQILTYYNGYQSKNGFPTLETCWMK